MVQRRGKPPEYVLHRKERKERRNGRRASPPPFLSFSSHHPAALSPSPRLFLPLTFIFLHTSARLTLERGGMGERGGLGATLKSGGGPRPECEKKKRGNWAASPHTHTLSHAVRPEEVCMGNARGKKVMNIIRRVRSKVPLNPSWEPRLLSTRVVMTSKVKIAKYWANVRIIFFASLRSRRSITREKEKGGGGPQFSRVSVCLRAREYTPLSSPLFPSPLRRKWRRRMKGGGLFAT